MDEGDGTGGGRDDFDFGGGEGRGDTPGGPAPPPAPPPIGPTPPPDDDSAEARRLVAVVRDLGYQPQLVGADQVRLVGLVHPDPAVPWEALKSRKAAIVALLRAEADGPARASPSAAAGPAPPRVERDESYPLAVGLGLYSPDDEPYRRDEAAVEAVVQFWLRRWRDPGNETTVRTFREAARKLPVDVLKGLILDAERPEVRQPVRHFIKAAASELAWQRRATRPAARADDLAGRRPGSKDRPPGSVEVPRRPAAPIASLRPSP